MPRIAKVPKYSDEILEPLRKWSTSRTLQFRMVERAKIIFKLIEGQSDSAMPRELGDKTQHCWPVASPGYQVGTGR
ncbi:MAG: hypothetical protein LBF22_06050, partial [Deltaproteobacteria bacterium]|nr:hypothetical protein [Deltaproteobacteria bacterium]